MIKTRFKQRMNVYRHTSTKSTLHRLLDVNQRYSLCFKQINCRLDAQRKKEKCFISQYGEEPLR